MKLLPRPPLAELLDSIARVIREFRPPPHHPTQPRWVSKKTGAPAGHWLLPAGCRVHVYNIPAVAKAPCVLVALTDDAAAVTKEPCAIWDVPVGINILWPVHLAESDVDERLMALKAILTEKLETENPAQVLPWDRLSNDQVHVWNHGIRDIRPAPEKTENNMPVLTLTFTVRCGTKAP